MNFVMHYALVQDRSLDMLTSSPEHYQCTTDRHCVVFTPESCSSVLSENEAGSLIFKHVLLKPEGRKFCS